MYGLTQTETFCTRPSERIGHLQLHEPYRLADLDSASLAASLRSRTMILAGSSVLLTSPPDDSAQELMPEAAYRRDRSFQERAANAGVGRRMIERVRALGFANQRKSEAACGQAAPIADDPWAGKAGSHAPLQNGSEPLSAGRSRRAENSKIGLRIFQLSPARERPVLDCTRRKAAQSRPGIDPAA